MPSYAPFPIAGSGHVAARCVVRGDARSHETTLELFEDAWLGHALPTVQAAMREHLARAMFSFAKEQSADDKASAVRIELGPIGEPHVRYARDDDGAPVRDLLLAGARAVYRP